MQESTYSSNRNRNYPFQSQVRTYEEQLLSIRRMHDSAVRNLPISLDESMTEADMRINRRAQRLMEAARNDSSDQCPRMEQYICDKISFPYQRYAQFDQSQQHSSEEEIPIQYDLQDIIDSVSKEPVPGKISFIVKIIKAAGAELTFSVENIKSIKKDKLNIVQLHEAGNFILYEIQTNSFHKKIAIHLNLNGRSILHSRHLNFSNRSIYLDIGLSYDFDQGALLESNSLEFLLAICILQGEKLANEVLELNGRKAFKTQLMSKGYKIDKLTQNLIRNNPKNRLALIKLLKFLLEEDQWKFGSVSDTSKSQSYKSLAKIYLEETQKFSPKLIQDSDQVSEAEIISFFQMYLHLLCLTIREPQLSKFNLAAEVYSTCTNKLSQLIQYFFQVKDVRNFHRLIVFCINNGSFMLPVGYDTLKQYITNSGISSPNFILSHFENILYHLLKNKQGKAQVIIQAFTGSNFATNANYSSYLKSIQSFSQKIFAQVQLQPLSFDQFSAFYQIYFMFRSNKDLVSVSQNPALRQKIIEYMQSIRNKMSTAVDKEKIKAIYLLQHFYVKERDDQLVGQDLSITSLLPILLNSYINNAEVLKALISLYFEVLKRTGSIFSEEAIKSMSNKIYSISLSKLTPERSLSLISKHFQEDVLHSEVVVNILSDTILNPILTKWLPETKQTVQLIQKSEHKKWHHEFKYNATINQMIVERILKIVNKIFKDNHLDKQNAINQIKSEISLHVNNEQEKSSLLALLNVEIVDLSEQKVLEYFTEKVSLLKVLLKIKDKKDDRTTQLHKSLKGIYKRLSAKDISFEIIQKITKLKPHEKNIFTQLTDDFQIPQLVEALFATGSLYISTIGKIKDFIRQIDSRFKCSDTDKCITQIQNCQKQYLTNSIKSQRLYTALPFFENFKEEILKCYKFQSFYGGRKLQGKSIEFIVKCCHELLGDMQRYIEMLYNDCKNDSLKSSAFYYFNPKKESVKEFRQLLIVFFQEIPDQAQTIVKIYELIAHSKEFYKRIHAFTVIQGRKFSIKEFSLLQLEHIYKNIIDRADFNISGLVEKEAKAKNKLKEYKINLEQPDSLDVLDIFALLIENEQLEPFLRDIEPHIKGLKEKINDEGGQVSYDELQYCSMVLYFFNHVYNKDYRQFVDFISAVKAYQQQKLKISKYWNLHTMIKAIITCQQKLLEEKKNFIDNNRLAVRIIDEAARKTVLKLSLDPKNYDQVKTSMIIFPEEGQKIIEDRELQETKEKALFICDSKKEEDQERIKIIPIFLKICREYEIIIEMEQKLVDLGYRQFSAKEEEIVIIEGNLAELEQKIRLKHQTATIWKKRLEQIYSHNFRAAHLQGKNIHAFSEFLISQTDDIPTQFTIINEDSNIHKEIKGQIKSQLKKQVRPQERLDGIDAYFRKLKQKQHEEQAEDREQKLIHFCIQPKGEVDFIRGIQRIGPKRIEKLKFQHLLICTSQINMAEISSFINRALRDPDNQYVMLGYQDLGRKQQQFLIDEITNFQREVKNGQDLNVKLCLIGDSQIDLLYKFATKELKTSEEDQEQKYTVEAAERAYVNKIKKDSSNLTMVVSQKTGYGKSTYIKQDSLNKGYNNQLYISLSGNMMVPVDGDLQCEKYLYDKFKQISQSIKRRNNSSDTCIIIEVFNIEASAIDSVNKFLTNVILYRKHKYRNNYCSIPLNVHIYIEVQNISNSTLKKLADKNLPVQINQLTFLKEIWKLCPQRIVNLRQFQVTDLKVQKSDLQLQYMLNFLKSLKNNTINTNYIGPFGTNIQILDEVEARRLIQQFFFSRFAANDRPSGHLWTYFRTLLFSALKTYSNSVFLSEYVLDDLDKNIEKQNPTLHKEMKLKESFRRQFLDIIVKNCVDFIMRSVKPGDEGSASSLQTTLRDIPFLIVPNADGSTFSFIYSNSLKVPKTIKQLIVMQDTQLINRIRTTPIDKLFQQVNLAKIQKENTQLWKERASEILSYISGNKNYRIDCQDGYVVNIDNFFKICLIIQRIRAKIPIIIMGQAGIGKTALLRHVVKHLFNHQLKIFNINAGLPLINPIQNQSDVIDIEAEKTISLSAMINTLETSYRQIANQPQKKLWVFFDEFNTLKQVGFFKEIIVDKRFLGKQIPALKQCILMAACNPHKKLEKKQDQDEVYTIEKKDKLAFDVLPAPHSLVESMWNYGALTDYEYEKYIKKMVSDMSYKTNEVVKLVLEIHKKIKGWLHESAVSLRDIERLRQLFRWFAKNLQTIKVKDISSILGSYNNVQERATIMAFYFTYILRFNRHRRGALEEQIEKALSLNRGFVNAAKSLEENDFCSRLNVEWQSPIVFNESLKENIYTCFVCLNTRLPLIIVGSPGCSKSLSLRLLTKNLGQCKDEYIVKFKKTKIYSIQGSENTTTDDVKQVFQRAYEDLIDKQTKQFKKVDQLTEISLIMFDELGLAEKSPDNPLKVLHPYLQVNRDQNLDSREISFIGISNSELDVSKMSRLLLLRRPPNTDEDLEYTALAIAEGQAREYMSQKIRMLVKQLTRAYTYYMPTWKAKRNGFELLYGLRDLYGLIKNFMAKFMDQQLYNKDDDVALMEAAKESIVENFSAWQGSNVDFMNKFFEYMCQNETATEVTMTEVLTNLKKTLSNQSYRYPLVIAEDEESLFFLKWAIEEHFKDKSRYIQGSPYKEQKEYSIKLLKEVCGHMEQQVVLILNNLKEAVKTGLYDFLNKSFNLNNQGRKYLKLKTKSKSSSTNSKYFFFNNKFNCLYLLNGKELENVQPPFLSRFQKYRFSIKSYRSQNCMKVLKRIEKFKTTIQRICTQYKYDHYNFENLFINSNEKALQSLSVACYEHIRNSMICNQDNSQRLRKQSEAQIDLSELGYKQALKRLVYNSGQDFYFFFKYVIEKNALLAEIKEWINEFLEQKNKKEGDQRLYIRFTNELNYMNRYIGKAENVCVEFETIKAESDIQDSIASFFKSNDKKGLYISMKVLQESQYLNYVVSQVEKLRKKAILQKENLDDKKIRIIYYFTRDRVSAENGQKEKQIAISPFSNYIQEFDDGKVGTIGTQKDQLFKQVVKMEDLLTYVHKSFDITFEDPQNSERLKQTLDKIKRELQLNKNSLFHKSCIEVAGKLETNYELSEDNIKELLSDRNILKKYSNFKTALTHYLADKKLFGVIAVFIKYLIEKQSYLSFSEQFLYDYLKVESYPLDKSTLDAFKDMKKIPAYKDFVRDLLANKISFITQEYQKLKMIKRLPNSSKITSIKMCKSRLVPFSKVEFEILLDCSDKKLGWYAQQIYKNSDKINQTYEAFIEQFKLKTTFKKGKNNLYIQSIDNNAVLKKMLFFDLLLDFCSSRNIPTKYISEYYDLMLPIIGSNTMFMKMAAILIGLEQMWIEVFKIMNAFYEENCKITIKYPEAKTVNKQVMLNYCRQIIKQIQSTLLSKNFIKSLEGSDRYSKIFLNALFQMQRLESQFEVEISSRLKSIRSAIIFIDISDSSFKARRIQQFISKIVEDSKLSYYQHALNYFDSLKDASEKSKQITEFKANTIFLQWFKAQRNQAETKKCLTKFIQNCKQELFAHNSVATINHFVEFLKPKYHQITKTFQILNNIDPNQGKVIKELSFIGENSKKGNHRDNLSIVITNMFMQKINAALQKGRIVRDKMKEFKEIMLTLTNSETHGVARQFAIAFIKIFLQDYINRFTQKQNLEEFDEIDDILSKKQNPLCVNFRFYCLKLLRTKMSIKQIKNQYIKINKCKWIKLIDEIDIFQENESRSLIVPKEHKSSEKLKVIFADLIQKEGKPDSFDQLFEEGSISPENRYSLLTFFFRFYFSMAYNAPAHKQAVLAKLQKEKVKYQQLLGEVQYQLIQRYANNKFDERIKISRSQQFNEDLFFLFNPINWLLATRLSVSPLNSLFFNNGKFHQNFKPVFDASYFPCGPQNPFINIAQSVYELTRSTNLGVYICSGQCDYLYSHQNCGWPNDSSLCRICGQPIGTKNGKGHTLSRDDQGARRVMSHHLVDNWNFYVGNLAKLPHFNDAQRCYIEGEINRMKSKDIIVLKDKNMTIKGYHIDNQGRVSTLTYYIIRSIFNSIFYNLISLKVITPEQCTSIFQSKDSQEAQHHVWQKYSDDVAYIKKALNLDRKIYGWIFGVHSFLFEMNKDFSRKFSEYKSEVYERANTLASQIEEQVTQKKISNTYFEMYKDIAATLRNGLIHKQIMSVTDMTAINRFTRDIFEELLERFIKVNTAQEKFNLSEASSTLQGTMQFPNDGYLTEDKIDQNKFPYSRLLKLPDQPIKYSQIVVAFELHIREKYPFLDYVLKNSDLINSMADFQTVLAFSNSLFQEVQNTYQRKDGERSLKDFMRELEQKRQNNLSEILMDPQAAVNAWNRLAKRLGTLQNACTVVGKMNDEYSLDTEVKAFLIDNVSKKNPYGLILSALFHNFAIIHNDLMTTLNGRKNMIPQYKSLNLFIQNKKISPQKLRENDVFVITQRQLIDKLSQYSISSISYGKNFIFTNFESYQHYFLMKLQGKCEFLSTIQEFKSICYNGQAFAQSSKSSNTLAEIRNFFYKQLQQRQRQIVHKVIKSQKSIKEIEESAIRVRGDLEKIMITINLLNGLVNQPNIGDFVDNNKVQTSSPEIMEFGQINIEKIVSLYQLIELQMKEGIIQRLPEQYKEKIALNVEQQLKRLLQSLPIDPEEQSMYISLVDFGKAVYRFIARNLQGGIMPKENKIMEFLPSRQDFWPKDFEEYKLAPLFENQVLKELTLAHICALFKIIEQLVHKKVSASVI